MAFSTIPPMATMSFSISRLTTCSISFDNFVILTLAEDFKILVLYSSRRFMKTLISRSIINSGGAAMLYIGLDLHRSFSYITIMNDKGETVGHKKLPSMGR
jgi:hypothetical protein